ncbi:MAG: ABC transporter substrate-binding protein [Candidatus Cloacimonetes bacterium]|nr:ABC transporter substrate-binding protein [Candidatus Cloacimonadota bacterium]
MRYIVYTVLLLTIFLFGCGQRERAEQLEFWHALGGPLGDALNELIREFNAAHPDIHINAISMGNYTALSQKLMASIQAGTQPDIAQVFESWTAGLVAGGVLVPFDKLIEEDEDFGEEDFADIYQVFIDSSTMDGKLWSFPFNKSVRVLYYNKDIFFRTGLDPNRPPRTWEEFREYCRKTTIDLTGNGQIDQYGTTFSTSVWMFENLLLQAGGELMTPDYRRPLFHLEPGVKALEHLNTLLNVDGTAYLSAGFEWQNDLLASKVAMVEGSSVSAVYMKRAGIDFFLGIAALPIDETNRSVISGTNICIFDTKDEKRHRAAWTFIKWFTDTEQTARWSYMTYYMPVRKSAFEVSILQNRLYSNPEMAEVYDQLAYATFEPPIAEWFEIRRHLEEQVLERVLRQRIGAREALQSAADRLTQMIERKEVKSPFELGTE